MTDSTFPEDLNPIGDARENDDPEQLVADGLEGGVPDRVGAHQNDDPDQLAADGLRGDRPRPTDPSRSADPLTESTDGGLDGGDPGVEE
ncbi:hypothetical protein FLP10_03730 [Agromyces intestinalis]|uniref:Uncharacterized protein n=1 Tax=Agromyces intestinalis TaxID=2592652 RepID=A0A5C1YF65_9MICO|nr:hypothetical protein [Agromyces intestinalis]QEO13629.1 hypothetical protein FLP10_03730 [Agromyces intestinalis]